VIEGKQMRDAPAEAAAASLPWPHFSDGSCDPIAQACWAVDHAFHDSVAEQPGSWDEAQLKADAPAVAKRWREAEAARDVVLRSLAVAQTPGLLEAAAIDPLGRVNLGAGLADFLAAALQWSAASQGVKRSPVTELASHIRRTLDGSPYSVRQFLPSGHVRPDLRMLRQAANGLSFPRQPPRLPHDEALRVSSRLLALGLLRAGGWAQ
jgi:hypothetical protein